MGQLVTVIKDEDGSLVHTMGGSRSGIGYGVRLKLLRYSSEIYLALKITSNFTDQYLTVIALP